MPRVDYRWDECSGLLPRESRAVVAGALDSGLCGWLREIYGVVMAVHFFSSSLSPNFGRLYRFGRGDSYIDVLWRVRTNSPEIKYCARFMMADFIWAEPALFSNYRNGASIPTGPDLLPLKLLIISPNTGSCPATFPARLNYLPLRIRSPDLCRRPNKRQGYITAP